jgi:LDH2 family malate/lactate/ureidoglycolate dehydrogenase
VRDAGPFQVPALTELVREMLVATGATTNEAAVVAQHVIDAEARENRSQGLIRVPAYVRWAQSGQIASGAPVTVERDSGSVLVIDGHDGWGHVTALRAIDLCVERATATAACFAVVRRANHIGRLGFFVERAAARGCVGMISCSGNPSSSWVAPWGGTEPLFGTNPIAIGFPRSDGAPVVVDVSTTQGARGNVLLAQKTGRRLPEGWAFDDEGNPTQDPMKALPPTGTLAPLGGHKGYALAIAVEILCGVLSGLWPPETSSIFVGALRVDAFLPRATYDRSLADLIARVKSVPPRPGGDAVRIPGEGSAARGAAGMKAGVTVAAELWNEIIALARQLNVDHALVTAG